MTHLNQYPTQPPKYLESKCLQKFQGFFTSSFRFRQRFMKVGKIWKKVFTGFFCFHRLFTACLVCKNQALKFSGHGPQAKTIKTIDSYLVISLKDKDGNQKSDAISGAQNITTKANYFGLPEPD